MQDNYAEQRHWLSSNRDRVDSRFSHMDDAVPVDDALGADFCFRDSVNLFRRDDDRGKGSIRTVFLEVKGCAQQSPGFFVLTKNELSRLCGEFFARV